MALTHLCSELPNNPGRWPQLTACPSIRAGWKPKYQIDYFDLDWLEIENWCKLNCIGKFDYWRLHLYLENDDDYLRFKLKFL